MVSKQYYSILIIGVICAFQCKDGWSKTNEWMGISGAYSNQFNWVGGVLPGQGDVASFTNQNVSFAVNINVNTTNLTAKMTGNNSSTVLDIDSGKEWKLTNMLISGIAGSNSVIKTGWGAVGVEETVIGEGASGNGQFTVSNGIFNTKNILMAKTSTTSKGILNVDGGILRITNSSSLFNVGGTGAISIQIRGGDLFFGGSNLNISGGVSLSKIGRAHV